MYEQRFMVESICDFFQMGLHKKRHELQTTGVQVRLLNCGGLCDVRYSHHRSTSLWNVVIIPIVRLQNIAIGSFAAVCVCTPVVLDVKFILDCCTILPTAIGRVVGVVHARWTVMRTIHVLCQPRRSLIHLAIQVGIRVHTSRRGLEVNKRVCSVVENHRMAICSTYSAHLSWALIRRILNHFVWKS
jgi:hypothetical protein